MAFETVPIPRSKARNKQPMKLEVEGLDAWPNHRFEIRLDWNDHMKRWLVRLTHLNDDTEFARGPVGIMQSYNYQNYVSFIFFDPSGDASSVRSDNLGDNVVLGVFPREDGGGYPD